MSKKLTTEEFQNRLNKIYGNQFTVLSDYINNETKIDILCNKCGSVIQKKPAKMTGSCKEGCYICSGKNHYKTKESLQKEIDKKFPDTYEIIGEYVKSRQPLTVKRLICGHIYDISPDNLLRGKGCPCCGLRQSHYMDIVESFFDKNNIDYEKEKRFSDCRYVRVLPFDYYLPKYNMCIEVDGEFHYPNNNVYLNKHSVYEEISIRDNIKTQYCKDNNIKLLRLPYFKELEFEKILKENLIDKVIC